MAEENQTTQVDPIVAPVAQPPAVAPVAVVPVAAAPVEDVTGLKNTVAALRAELAQTRTQHSNEINTLRQDSAELSTLRQQLASSQIDSTTNQVLANVLPQYRPLVENAVRAQLVTTPNGVAVADGRSVADLTTEMIKTYPNLFVADVVPTGSGTSPSTAAAQPPASVVTAPNGIIQGVDPNDIIQGKVQVKPQ